MSIPRRLTALFGLMSAAAVVLAAPVAAFATEAPTVPAVSPRHQRR